MVQLAKSYAAVQDRSVPKQIEHWVKIGRIAIDNPDIPYEMIERLLIAREEHRRGEVNPYDASIFDPDPNEDL